MCFAGLKYIRLSYELDFKDNIVWSGIPETIFRSVIGMQLHRICCVFKKEKNCSSCTVHETCVYSWLFESHIQKDNTFLEGRDRAPHPFVLEYDQINSKKGILSIVYIEKGRNFIPYITEAINKAGERGIAKLRTPFTIRAIKNNGLPYEFDFKTLDAASSTWNLDSYSVENDSILVEFLSPLRIKKEGRYISSITGENLINACARRISILSSLYGEYSEVVLPTKLPSSQIIDQRWKNRVYYSSRQQTSMKLGGVVGKLIIEGPIDKTIIALLDAGSIFHVGKNVVFGLGRIKLSRGNLYA